MSTAPLIATDCGEALDARRSTFCALVPASLSLLLLTAAFLKGYELYAAPLPEASVWGSRTLRIAAVEAEGFLGLWLLSGVWVRGARWAALAAFHVFFTMSLSRALAGEESCGCFGRVPIDPRWTAALDLVAILALWRWRPAERSGWPVGAHCLRVAAVPILFLLVGVPGGLVLAGRWPEMDAEGSRVVLRPETWVGRCCPLLPYADIGDELSNGRWLVVLYRHDCPHCREVIPLYEAKARAAADSDAPQDRISRRAAPRHPAVEVRPRFVLPPGQADREQGVVRQHARGGALARRRGASRSRPALTTVRNRPAALKGQATRTIEEFAFAHAALR